MCDLHGEIPIGIFALASLCCYFHIFFHVWGCEFSQALATLFMSDIAAPTLSPCKADRQIKAPSPHLLWKCAFLLTIKGRFGG